MASEQELKEVRAGIVAAVIAGAIPELREAWLGPRSTEVSATSGSGSDVVLIVQIKEPRV